MEELRRSAQEELMNNILPFWINNMRDLEEGGFYGRIDGYNKVHPQANKGAVSCARLLWTFSAAYRLLKKPEYLAMAQRAFDYIVKYFLDSDFGGVYWELNYKGEVISDKKQGYAQGFALYAFSEFYRATGNEQALQLAKDFFFLLQNRYDRQWGGYLEAYSRNWGELDDVRLSDRDANEKKSMNTHLHILEPFTNLCRIWKDERLYAAQRALIDIFTKHIVNSSGHLNLFFDEQWNLKSNGISYGHDIEASWLLYEAAETLGDPALTAEIKQLSLKIADAAAEGLQPDCSMVYERTGEHCNNDRDWWVQAEAVVGFMYAWKNSGNNIYKERAEKTWAYIRQNLRDSENGEWHWGRKANGGINRDGDKAGFWKCPYHNGRMCMELLEHF